MLGLLLMSFFTQSSFSTMIPSSSGNQFTPNNNPFPTTPAGETLRTATDTSILEPNLRNNPPKNRYVPNTNGAVSKIIYDSRGMNAVPPSVGIINTRSDGTADTTGVATDIVGK